MKQKLVVLLFLALNAFFSSQTTFGYESSCSDLLLNMGEKKVWFKRAVNPVVYETPHTASDFQQQSYKHLAERSLFPSQALQIFVRSRIKFMERELGVPVKQILDDRLGFFITRFEYWNDEVEVKDKWINLKVFSYLKHYSNSKAKGTRMITPFLIKSEPSDASLIRGASEAAVVSLRTGRPKPLPEAYWPLFVESKGESLDNLTSTKMPSYNVDIDWKEELVEQNKGVYLRHVEEEDLDPFGHMNSARYLRVLLETHEEMFQRRHSDILYSWFLSADRNVIRYARIKFKNQLKLGDQYMVKNVLNRLSKDGRYLEMKFIIKNLSTNQIVTSGRFIYNRSNPYESH